MRQLMKFLHTWSSAGVIGALFAYMLVLVRTPQATALQYADMRVTIEAICNVILIPSLGVSLVTGLLSMAVHRPYQEKTWAWIKALLGIGMFEATFAISQSKAHYAAELARKIAEGEPKTEMLELALRSEWTTLWALMAISVANIALGVWRPRFKFRKAVA